MSNPITRCFKVGKNFKFTINGEDILEKNVIETLLDLEYTKSIAIGYLEDAKSQLLSAKDPKKSFDLTAPELTKDDYKLLKPIKYCYTDVGLPQWLVCRDEGTSTYSPCVDTVQGLRQTLVGNRSLFEKIKDQYSDIVSDLTARDIGALTPIRELISYDEDTGRISSKKNLFFSAYLEAAEPFMAEDTENFLLREVKSLSNNPQTPNFAFFDKDMAKQGDCKSWLDFEEHFSEHERMYFRAWVGSIFIEECTDTRALWLTDKGGSGKSSVVNALQEVLGSAYGVLDSNHMGKEFIGAELLSKRLIVEPDCKSPNLLMHGLIHKLVTGDALRIERKGKDAFTSKVYARVLICSNVKPIIDSNKQSDSRRLALIELKPYSDDMNRKIYRTNPDGSFVLTENKQKIFIGNHNFADALKKELYAYLYLCFESYKQLCPNNDNISLPKDMANAQGEATLDDDVRLLGLVIDKYLTYDKDAKTTPEEFALFLKLLNKNATKGSYFKDTVSKIIDGRALLKDITIGWSVSRKIMVAGARISKRFHTGFTVNLPDGFTSVDDTMREEVETIANQFKETECE